VDVSPNADIAREATRILAAATTGGVPVRLIGGLAVQAHAGDALHPALRRDYKDIDLATLRGKSRDVVALLTAAGYAPDREFNAMNGDRRLLFRDEWNARQVDVFVGEFSMCHAVPIVGRIDAHQKAIPSAELLLTKLQVVELNEKDRRDAIALLLHQDVADHDEGAINAAVIARLLAGDWGLWRTSQINFERVRESLGGYALSEPERATVRANVDEIWRWVDEQPKATGWRLRARVGDRKRWYEIPEEVG
jgi:hypothetical protein